jgi:Zn-dependent protease
MSNIHTIHDTPRTTTSSTGTHFSMSPIGGGQPIYVGTLFGIEITLHPLLLIYFVVSAALPWILNSSTMTMKVWLYLVVVNIPLLFGTVLLHELGHCFATRRVGGEVHGILLWPLGGLAYIGHSGDAKDDLIVSIAGPLTHIPQALLWYGLSKAFTPGTFMEMLCIQALWLNISLMLFNLFIPCYPLDGGRIFAASLQLMKVRVDIAAKICACVSLVCAAGIGLYGFLYNEIIAMFIGFWCAQESYNLYVFIKEERLQEHQLFSKYAIETNDGPYNQI